MNEILHANIFFIIASVATVCFCILVSVALYHIIKILQLVRSVMERVDAGVEVLASDVSQVRMFFSEGSFLSRLLSMIPGATPTKPRRKRANINKDLNNDDE